MELCVAAHGGARPLLCGPTRRLTPLAVTRAAVILGSRDLLPLTVVAADGVALPGSLVLPLPTAQLVGSGALAGVGIGTAASVGEGRLTVGTLQLRVVRWWSLPRCRPEERPIPVGGLAAARQELERRRSRLASVSPLPAEEARLLGRGAAFASALVADDEPAAVTAADGLLGLGPGLTPSGDDVIAGVLVALQRLRPGCVDRGVADAVLYRAWERTTPVSASLLHWAARGDATAALLGYLDALAAGADTRGELDRLERVGHSSGLDLAVGALAGASALSASALSASVLSASVLEPSASPGTRPRARLTGAPR
ncbi:MAG: oxamate carbamoyltransferase subunit AllH family protein [Actinomycetales bacterium]